ncbi:hypothetical protein BDV35DRAFT_223870 [Aspergillus flavus]|uniref:Uncharacterized protein n=1 Tax=Aspergillus flavus TaxID=5059 RepID=A0A5N6HG43_ASPFL|nr:hypothetical protein BDV35DRAFT_223870 [Aspergillus flavus]
MVRLTLEGQHHGFRLRHIWSCRVYSQFYGDGVERSIIYLFTSFFLFSFYTLSWSMGHVGLLTIGLAIIVGRCLPRLGEASVRASSQFIP